MSHFQKGRKMKTARFFTHWRIIPDKVYCLFFNNKKIAGQELFYVKSKKAAKKDLCVLRSIDFKILRTMRNLEKVSVNNWISIKDIFFEASELYHFHNEKELGKRLDVLFCREFIIYKLYPEPRHLALTSKYWMWFNIFKWCLHIIAGVIIVTLSALILQWIGLSETIVVEIIKTLG